MRKKMLVASLTLALAAVMIGGCGNSKENDTAQEQTTESQVQTTSTVDYSQGLNDDGTLAGDNNADYVTLCDYSAIEIPESEVAVEDSEVDTEVDSLIANFQTENQVTDRAVQDGDVVNIDYVGTVDGEEFDGGSAEGYDLTIGSGSFIDDFEDQLIGHNPGDEVQVEVTFPDDYSSEDLAGKDAVFDTTINYISETVTPDLTDDFVKENLEEAYGYTSVDDMKEKIRQNLQDDKEYNYIWTYMMENSTFEEIPEELVELQLNVVIDGLEASLSLQGTTMEDYLSSSGYEDEEALRDAYYEDCENMVKTYLIADKVAQEQNLSVTDDEVSNYFKKFYNTDSYDSYVDYYTRAYVNRIVLNNLVTETLADMAQVG